jgi:hypothetical protein
LIALTLPRCIFAFLFENVEKLTSPERRKAKLGF